MGSLNSPVGIRAVSVLLAGVVGCGSAPMVSPEQPTKFKVEWSFGGGADGADPTASLVNANGTLYGTTVYGGRSGCRRHGCGTVYSLDPVARSEKVLYAFCSQQNCTDGSLPGTNLIDVNGILYGTTEGGGSHGYGTAFGLDPKTGAETVLYSFCALPSCTDGAYPAGNLIDVKGRLYGTTNLGGAQNAGTAFVLYPSSGTETVLYSFCTQDNCADGAFPRASLTEKHGILYGTTVNGGAGCDSFGCGTVFSIDPSTGAEAALHFFAGDTDGAFPYADLIDVNGVLYGTTSAGGQTCGTGDGCGTVFSLDLGTNVENVVYGFCQRQYCSDGALPFASLIALNGKLFGTTSYGGRTGCTQTGGCGTVFSVNPDTGAEEVLHEFCSVKHCTDGWAPRAGLTVVNGTLYGTTAEGGAHGSGTVFAIR